MSTVLSDLKVLGDVLKYEVHPAYTRESGTFKNISAAYEGSVLGQPVKVSGANYVNVLAADIANAEGILLLQERVDLALNEVHDAKVAVLVRGPAVVLKDELPTTDLAGDAINMTNFEARLLALGIVCRDAPVETSIQLT